MSEREHIPEPCTAEARAKGCICRMSSVNSASIDPPEPMISPWCPLHGSRDPDAEYERERDDRLDRTEFEEQSDG